MNLDELTPTNEELLKAAEESPPPLSWYEDCINPFEWDRWDSNPEPPHYE